MKTTYTDRDGNLAVNGSFNFEGSVAKLRDILNDVIKEHGEDVECKLDVFSRFPHNHNSHIIIKEKK